MAFKGIYIDDDTREFRYARLLSDSNKDGITFQCKQPGILGKFAQEIIDAKPDLVAMDYRLDENQQDNSDNDYRASPLAQQLRDKLCDQPNQDFPIILISTEEKIETFFKPDKTAHDLYDEWYRKEKLIDSSKLVRKQIVSLIKGYKIIAKNLGDPNWHQKLLKLNKKEKFVIEDTNMKIEFEESKVVHVLARIFLRDMIKWSGILLKPEDVYAKLGIKLEDYTQVNEQVWSKLKEEKISYEGVFSDGWPRMWKHRFEFWTKDKLKQPITSIPAVERVRFVNELFSTDFKPASSLWTKNTDELFSFSCASCNHPTELRHSIAVYDPRLPNYLDNRRICYDCIDTDRYENKHLRIAQEDENLLEEIKTGKISRGE